MSGQQEAKPLASGKGKGGGEELRSVKGPGALVGKQMRGTSGATNRVAGFVCVEGSQLVSDRSIDSRVNGRRTKAGGEQTERGQQQKRW